MIILIYNAVFQSTNNASPTLKKKLKVHQGFQQQTNFPETPLHKTIQYSSTPHNISTYCITKNRTMLSTTSAAVSRTAALCGRCSMNNHNHHRVAAGAVGAVRNLNVHEYVSMEIMNAHHIPTPRSYVARTPEEAESIYTHKLAHRKSISGTCK
jgi:hypothetical protein